MVGAFVSWFFFGHSSYNSPGAPVLSPAMAVAGTGLPIRNASNFQQFPRYSFLVLARNSNNSPGSVQMLQASDSRNFYQALCSNATSDMTLNAFLSLQLPSYTKIYTCPALLEAGPAKYSDPIFFTH